MTGTVLVKIAAAAHVASAGPYSRKVSEPVGLKPPARVAVSEIYPPMTTLSEALVVIVGWLRPTETTSRLQSPDAPLVAASPL